MSFITFLLAATVLALVPGPGIAYVVARTIAGGRSEGFASCLGTALGGMFHVFASALGLSFIIAKSALAFGLVKYLGAAYLIYMGVRLLLRKEVETTSLEIVVQGPRKALVEGVVVEEFNVKTALFFVAFLPQFTQPSQPLVPQLVLLGGICVALNTLADVAAVLAASRLLATSAVRAARARLMTRASGATMVGLGTYLALAQRET